MRRLPGYILILLPLLLAYCTTPDERRAMRSGLDSICRLNRTGLPFTAADVQPYVRFFDRHGTSNDRLLAHYLLGRAYHEQGEAPMALECYQEALDCADTTSTECDFAQLSKVYGQMAEVFFNQSLYQKHLHYTDLAAHAAQKGRDTLTANAIVEQKSLSYIQLGQLDSAIRNDEDVAATYYHYQCPVDAAIALGSATRSLLRVGEVEKAKYYMSIYEYKSELFDEKGEIEAGREIYYHFKGLYYQSTKQLDSAEYWFRKELRDGKDFNNQNAGAMGLASVYEQRHMPDSAAKYYKYAYAMNDSMYTQMATETIERMQAMYDYNRYKKETRNAEKQAEHNKAIWQWGGAIVVIVLLIIIHITHKIQVKRREMQRQYEQSQKELVRINTDIIQAEKEITLLKTTHNTAIEELISVKEHQIKTLQIELNKHQDALHENIHEQELSRAERELKESTQYKTLMTKINKGMELNNKDWLTIESIINDHFPNCHLLISTKSHLLTLDEYRVCMLMRIHVNPSSVRHIIGKSDGSITNIRIRLLKKIFDEDGKAKTFDYKISQIC